MAPERLLADEIWKGAVAAVMVVYIVVIKVGMGQTLALVALIPFLSELYQIIAI